MKHGLNKRSMIHWITWGVTGITLVLWFPIIALGILKLKEWITSSSIYQSLLASGTSHMNGYEPEVVTGTMYALIFSTEDWMMMVGTLVLMIILWSIKIKANKKVKK